MITKELIKSIDIFRELDDSETEKLTAIAREETYKKGDYIFKEKDPGGKVYIVESGVVEIGKSSRGNGKFVRLARLERGEILGELSIFEETQRSASALASLVPETKLIVWDATTLQKLFVEETNIANKVTRNLLKKMCMRLRLASEAIYTLLNVIDSH